MFVSAPQVDQLCSLPSWQGVVVGDVKTPSDWASGNCVFLGINTQRCLGYSVEPLLPFHRYERKIIGYLFAIERGAQVIFETDDDNEMKFDDIVMFNNISCARLSREGERYVNPYGAFGRPDIWPRGFPLNKISESRAADMRRGDHEMGAVQVLVQQGGALWVGVVGAIATGHASGCSPCVAQRPLLQVAD